MPKVPSRSAPIVRAVCCLFMSLSPLLPLAAVASLAANASAQGLVTREVVLNVATYRSPSRQMAIKIDPSSRGGAGEATYTLTKSGVQVWSAKLPITLWEAAVADDGTVVGYAYPGGYPFSYCTGQPEVPITAVIIDPTGTLRLGDPKAIGEGEADRTGTFMATFGGGVFLDQANDRMTIRAVLGSWADGRNWRTYQLSTGKFLGIVDPAPMVVKGEEQTFIKDIAVELVPGTPLVLVHRYGYRSTFPNQASDGDAGFFLLNPEGKTVWTLNIEHEYTDLGEHFNWSNLVGEPAFQIATRPLGFDIVSYKQGRISFAIEADGPSWKVRETGRTAENLPAGGAGDRPKPALASPATFELKSLGRITLGDSDPEPAIRNIGSFSIDAKGRIGWVRNDSPDGATLVLIDLAGKVVAQYPVPHTPDGRMPDGAIPLTPERWLVHSRGFGRKSDGTAVPAGVWAVNADTGAFELLDNVTLGRIIEAVPSGDGGFIVCGGQEGLLSHEVIAFDGQGRELWKGKYADSLAVTSAGQVALLHHSTESLEFLSHTGQSLRTVDLKAALKHTPNYLGDVYADAKAGVIVRDSDGSPDIYRLNAQDTLVASFNPHTPDNRSFNYFGGFQLDPENRLWTSDGHRFMRLDDQGVVDRLLGKPFDSATLGDIDTLTMDAQGLMYALDRSTKTLHVLDNQGRTIRVCRPSPEDIKQVMLGDIAIAPDRSIYCAGGIGNRDGVHYVHFAPDGTRLGTLAPDFDTITEKTRFFPDGSRLAIGYKELRIIAADGTLRAQIQRAPDGSWFGANVEATVGTDGTIVAISGGGPFGSRGGSQVSIYDATGKPLRSFPNPGISSMMNFSLVGPWLVGPSVKSVTILDTRNGEARQAPLAVPAGAQSWHYCMLTPPDPATGQREIWIRRAGERLVERFAFPN